MTLLSPIYKKYHKDHIAEILLEIQAPALVFLYGDLGAGKTTLVSQYIAHLTGKKPEEIISPTYTYYHTYSGICHFDLYRLQNYDDFVSIGGEEILDNNEGIIFIEWPQILEPYYTCNISLTLSHDREDENMRNIEIRKG